MYVDILTMMAHHLQLTRRLATSGLKAVWGELDLLKKKLLHLIFQLYSTIYSPFYLTIV